MARQPGPQSVARFEPRSESQRKARELYRERDFLFLVGGAGCGKTLAAVGLAACDVLSPSSGRERVVVLRPAVQADADLGFLKGGLRQKLEPYTLPVRQAFEKVSFRFPEDRVRYAHLGYERGVTYEDSVVILDEAQNASYKQLVLVLTRLARGSKLVVTGDPDQQDVRSTGRYPCDLLELLDRVEGSPDVGVVRFPEGESQRHQALDRLLPRLLPR